MKSKEAAKDKCAKKTAKNQETQRGKRSKLDVIINVGNFPEDKRYQSQERQRFQEDHIRAFQSVVKKDKKKYYYNIKDGTH